MATRSRRAARSAGILPVVLALACSRTAEAPVPGTSQGTPPDLRGRRVMVLPVQIVAGVQGDPDAELAFSLSARAPGVSWIMPAEIDRALARSPTIDARTRGLPVSSFLAAEVQRVGDPLFGQLLRMSALVDAEVAFIPVSMAGSGPGVSEPTRLSATLIHIRTGRVLWFGVVEGEAAPADDPRALASVADALARTLLWYVQG